MQKRPAEDKLDERSAKKQKIEQSSSNFLSLPKDILLEICHYITRLEDAMRFEITCKTIRSLMAEAFTTLHMIENHDFEHIERMLSRDLRYLTTLSLELPRLKSEQTNWLVNKLSTGLPHLRNLTSLKLNFEFKSESLWTMTLARVYEAIKKMTWLEVLECQYPLLSDLSESFVNHTKLTELSILGETPTQFRDYNSVKGFTRLTQVKALTLHSQMTDDMFSEVLQLTNLTALDIEWMTLPYDALNNISRLTNLDKFVCPSMVYRGPWKSLLRLPKLTDLKGDISNMRDEDSMEDINQMTQLTSLDLCDRSHSHKLSPEKLSNLTNLQKLTVDDAIGSAQFSVLRSLTQLSVGSWNILNLDVTLPRRLKNLVLTMEINTPVFEEVAQLTSLEILSILLDFKWEKPDFKEICKLTNLKELELIYGDTFPSGKKIIVGLRKSLRQLPLLRSLILSEVCDKHIADLKHLTQLNQLEVGVIKDDTNLEALRKQLPFIVYKGEVQQDDEDD